MIVPASLKATSRSTIVIVLLSFVVLGIAYWKNKPHKQADVIAAAKAAKVKINKSLKNYSYREAQDMITKEAGSVVGYFDDEQPAKVSTQTFSETKRVFRDYYFNDGMLALVSEQLYTYNKPNTYTEAVAKAAGDSVWYDDTKTTSTVNTYFFSDNKLIKWIGPDGNDVATNSAAFTKTEPELLSQAIYALSQLKAEE